MNCLEFRRRLGSEPACSLEDFVSHRLACSQCAAAHARADEFESRILGAFGVPVPVNLADRILLAQTTVARRETRNRRRGLGALLLAAAASIVVVLVSVRQPDAEMPALAGLVMDHLHEHVVSASETGNPVPRQDVINAFAARGVSLVSVPDGVNYVHKCPAGPYRTVHMVMPESSGPVSVVYVADKVSSARVDFAGEGMRGRELPLGKGSLVMLASGDKAFDAIEQAWKNALGGAVAMTERPRAHAPPRSGRLAGPASQGTTLAAP